LWHLFFNRKNQIKLKGYKSKETNKQTHPLFGYVKVSAYRVAQNNDAYLLRLIAKSFLKSQRRIWVIALFFLGLEKYELIGRGLKYSKFAYINSIAIRVQDTVAIYGQSAWMHFSIRVVTIFASFF
jgi:hypothetical protein